MATAITSIQTPRIVSHDEWLAERVAFLNKEKEFTRLRDELTRERQRLPWERVTKEYVFEGPNGQETLVDLFDGRSQLVVYHLMFKPSSEQPCSGCSFWADNFNGIDVHLAHRDITLLAISRAPQSKLQPFARRMGWTFKWVSSGDGDFNYDFDASYKPESLKAGTATYNYGTIPNKTGEDMPGVSVFYRDRDGEIYHTYSTYARGLDILNGAYHYIDLTPKGRDEDGNRGMFWLRLRDRYED